MDIHVEKAAKLLKDRDGDVLGINPDGSIQVFNSIKCKLFSYPDLTRTFTWEEIDGVRRVTRIVFESATFNAESALTIQIQRDFVYQEEDPYDLTNINDTLIVV